MGDNGACALAESQKNELETDFRIELNSDKHKHFLVQNETGEYLGLINLSLRSDYVQSASSTPVAYVEGIYVKPKYRKQGVTKALVEQAEKWANEQGCQELASDAKLSNLVSQKFHKSLGSYKTGVIVHYLKKVK